VPRQNFFDVALFRTSKKLIINFLDVLIFATSKNFDVAFLTKALKRQKLPIFFVVVVKLTIDYDTKMYLALYAFKNIVYGMITGRIQNPMIGILCQIRPEQLHVH
jgi:hypothetical protein